MNRIISSLLVVAALAVPAIAAADVHVYTRVNQVATDVDWSESYNSLDISGLRADGEHTYSYRITEDEPGRETRMFETCQRHAALAMSKPGRYALELRFIHPDERSGLLTGCTLRRLEPESRP